MPRNIVSPLDWKSPIVDPKTGVPSLQFIRLWQQLFGNESGTFDIAGAAQPGDADLTAISALSGTGIAVRISTVPEWTTRTLTAPAAGFSITNPAGIAGNPTFALTNDLGALEALSGTHTIYYRSATDTWSAVTIGTGLDFTGATLSCTFSGTVTTTGSPASGNLTKFSGASSITNGDLSGDVTTSGTLAATIPNDTVTFAKMQNSSAASRLVGRGSVSGAGDFEEITIGAGLVLTGTNLTASGGSATLADGDYGDITVSSSGTVMTIDNDVVTYAKMQNVSAASVLLGRGSSGGPGDTQEIALGSGLSMSGTTLSSGVPALVLIEKYVADGTTGTKTFSSIPGTYTDLEVRLLGRCDNGANQAINVTANGLGGTNYDMQRHYATSGTMTGDQALGAANWNGMFQLPGTANTAGFCIGGDMTLVGYSQTTFHKICLFHSRQINSTTSGAGYTISGAGTLRTTSAVTSLTFALAAGNYVSGSYIALYGRL